MSDQGSRNSCKQLMEHVPEGVPALVKGTLPMGLKYDQPSQRLSRQHALAAQGPHGLSSLVPFTVHRETGSIEFGGAAARECRPLQCKFEAPSLYPSLKARWSVM